MADRVQEIAAVVDLATYRERRSETAAIEVAGRLLQERLIAEARADVAAWLLTGE